MVKAICERAIWIERGRIAAVGSPHEIVDRYVRAVDDAAIEALRRERGSLNAVKAGTFPIRTRI